MPQNRFNISVKEIKTAALPIDIFKSIKDRPYSFFLDSACDPGKLGRFSFLGCNPFITFKSKSDSVRVEHRDSGAEHVERLRVNPFIALRRLLKKYEIVSHMTGIPFIGGAVGYFSYDMKRFIEDLPATSKDDLKLPDCILGFYDSVIIYDNLKGRCYISSLGISKRRSHALEGAIVSAYSADVYKGDHRFRRSSFYNLRSNFSKRSYAAAVNRAKEYIRKGDIYQVNISQRFKADFSGDPFDLYVRLRSCSPAPFASYLNFGDVAILSSSPERFLLKRNGRVETRPIKGTRPRGHDAMLDRFLEAELKNSGKDMAEHIMIVDLERNDLGRICEYGSVRPTESAIIERYANVFHMVSTVEGILKDHMDPVDCLVAAFPGGSITGAPKIRSMEIIDELERVRRSIYTGAIGYIGFNGNMDTSIVIRTFVIKSGKLYFQVGGGIVADSKPMHEYEETLHKAAGLMEALGTHPD